jgi:hypothetical protein
LRTAVLLVLLPVEVLAFRWESEVLRLLLLRTLNWIRVSVQCDVECEWWMMSAVISGIVQYITRVPYRLVNSLRTAVLRVFTDGISVSNWFCGLQIRGESCFPCSDLPFIWLYLQGHSVVQNLASSLWTTLVSLLPYFYWSRW